MTEQILTLLVPGCSSLMVTAQNKKGLVLNELNTCAEAAYIFNELIGYKNFQHLICGEAD